jgi:hypothetical protein
LEDFFRGEGREFGPASPSSMLVCITFSIPGLQGRHN